MKNRDRKYSKSWIKTILFLVPLSIIGLTGCNSKDSAVMQLQPTNSEQTDVSDKAADEAVTETEEDTDKGKETETIEEEDTEEGTVQETNTPETNDQTGKETDKQDKLTQLTGFLGLTKEKLSKTIGEEPKSIDEGGAEFTNYGIRVWFGEDSLVNQIYVMDNDITVNGVKTGDDISAFKEAFGEPVKDNNGDVHFKYGDIYLSVNYDTETKETFSIYILKEDF